MTLQEFYTRIGSSYDAVFARIPSEMMIRKFTKMYLQDNSLQLLNDSIAQEYWNDAFRAAHTLKGVAANLGFDTLQETASQLTELLRGGRPLTDFPLLEQVRSAHQQVVDGLQMLE